MAIDVIVSKVTFKNHIIRKDNFAIGIRGHVVFENPLIIGSIRQKEISLTVCFPLFEISHKQLTIRSQHFPNS